MTTTDGDPVLPSSEAFREDVRFLQEREASLVGIDEALRRGIADVEAGRASLASDVFNDLAAKYENAFQTKS